MGFGTSRHPWTLYFSAVIEGNPGYAAIGWVLKDSRDNEVVQKGTFVSENYTRIEAFYIAFIRGLQDAWRRNVAHIIVYGDSGVVCNQINQQWGVRNKRHVKCYDKALDLIKSFDTFHIRYILDAENKAAVRLAQDAKEEYLHCLHLLDTDSDYGSGSGSSSCSSSSSSSDSDSDSDSD